MDELEELEVDFNQAVEDENKMQKNEMSDVDNVPNYLSDGWHDYVMTLFTERELVNGHPNVNGLRRVAESLLGSIVSSGPTGVWPSNSEDGVGRATVIWETQIAWRRLDGSNKAQMYWGTEETLPIRKFADVADCWLKNSDPKYAVHTVATAATRAESRSLRKALRLNTISHEEESNVDISDIVAKVDIKPEWSGEDPISDRQKKVIESKCKELHIVLDKFLAEYKYEKLDGLRRSDGSKLVKVLSDYQGNHEDALVIPENIKGE